MVEQFEVHSNFSLRPVCLRRISDIGLMHSGKVEIIRVKSRDTESRYKFL